MLKLDKVSFSYGSGVPALDDISIDIENGKMYAVIGRTGSGKSTLIRHFNGLLRPQRGRVLVDGENISKKNTDMKAVRSRIGLVFQYPEQQLFAETVFDDIAFGPRNLGLDDGEIEKRVKEAAAAVSLSEELFGKSPFSLSGGEKRRTALAGVLAMKPQTLVLDEPSAGLDQGARRELSKLIAKIHDENPENTIVFVSHSMEEAASAEHIFVLGGGRLIAEGTPDEIFLQPELLRDAGLSLPRSAELIMKLQKRGIPVRSAYTPETAASEIAKSLEKERLPR